MTEQLAQAGLDIVIVCSGRQGRFSVEDTLCGGMIIDLLETQHAVSENLNDAASLALLLYRTNKESLYETIANGEHGRHLQKIGFESDIVTASQIDSIGIVPILKDGRLVNINESSNPEKG